MVVSSQRHFLDTFQQLRYSPLALYHYTQRERVREQPDQSFHLRPLTICDEGSDDDVFLAAEPVEEHRPGSVQNHEQCHFMLLRECLQPRAQSLIQNDGKVGTSI